MSALDPDVHTADDALREALDLGPAEQPAGRYPQHTHRVRVRQSAPGTWVAWLTSTDGEPEQIVGRFATMAEAAMRGITAARFVAAGIPWRAAS